MDLFEDSEILILKGSQLPENHRTTVKFETED
jgi:hypothetical protein